MATKKFTGTRYAVPAMGSEDHDNIRDALTQGWLPPPSGEGLSPEKWAVCAADSYLLPWVGQTSKEDDGDVIHANLRLSSAVADKKWIRAEAARLRRPASEGGPETPLSRSDALARATETAPLVPKHTLIGFWILPEAGVVFVQAPPAKHEAAVRQQIMALLGAAGVKVPTDGGLVATAFLETDWAARIALLFLEGESFTAADAPVGGTTDEGGEVDVAYEHEAGEHTWEVRACIDRLGLRDPETGKQVDVTASEPLRDRATRDAVRRKYQLDSGTFMLADSSGYEFIVRPRCGTHRIDLGFPSGEGEFSFADMDRCLAALQAAMLRAASDVTVPTKRAPVHARLRALLLGEDDDDLLVGDSSEADAAEEDDDGDDE